MKKIVIYIIAIIVALIAIPILKIGFYIILFSASINDKKEARYAKKEFIESLYENKGIVINPEKLKVEVINTINYTEYKYYIKNEYGKDIEIKKINERFKVANDNEFEIFISETKINPYLKNKYSFLDEEREKILEHLKEYKTDYNINIEPNFLYNIEDKLYIPNMYSTLKKFDELYYITHDYEDINSKIIKKINLRNMNFDEINPKNILENIKTEPILKITMEKNYFEYGSKEEYIKLNKFLQDKLSMEIKLVYDLGVYFEKEQIKNEDN